MTVYTKYLDVCNLATYDDGVFRTFRKNRHYTVVLEHVHKELGRKYLDEAIRQRPILIDYIQRFATSEKIGSPNTYDYDGVMLSPTTCRYIKVLSDLMGRFDLNKMHIVEVGVGYGGQCKIIHDLFTPKSYTIVDLPPALLVAEKFLGRFGIKPILRNPADDHETNYDLFMSNYAFTEIERKYQDIYAERFIKRSTHGYITCNFMATAKRCGRMTMQDLTALCKGVIMEDTPSHENDNFIFVW